jgi:hypothetical protein
MRREDTMLISGSSISPGFAEGKSFILDTRSLLTIIATIFIPLGFIAGIYGMNLDTDLPGNMPELNWPYGYVVALALTLAVALGLIIFFRRKGWIGSPRPPSNSA